MTDAATLRAVCWLAALSTPAAAPAAPLHAYNQCLLVPYAVYGAGGGFSAVGLPARADGSVYWQFVGARGATAAGSFFVAADTLARFLWLPEAVGDGFADEPGTLLFCIDRNGDGRIDRDDGDALAGNAFLIDLGAGDVAFLPTVSVDDSDLDDRDVDALLAADNRVARLAATPVTNDFLDLRYLADGAPGGDDTEIVIWTSAAPERAAQTLRLFDADGFSVATERVLAERTLHLIDPESLSGAAALLPGDGFLRWRIPVDDDDDTLFALGFSLVRSERFSAVQTVPGNW